MGFKLKRLIGRRHVFCGPKLQEGEKPSVIGRVLLAATAAGVGAITGGAGAVLIGAEVSAAATATAITSAAATIATGNPTIKYDSRAHDQVKAMQPVVQQSFAPSATSATSSASTASSVPTPCLTPAEHIAEIALKNVKPVGADLGDCATWVSNAIIESGIKYAKVNYAKDSGPSLLAAGFKLLPPGSPVRVGDIQVMQPITSGQVTRHTSGHMQILGPNGRWVSDWEQKNQIPWKDYQPGVDQVEVKTYRLEEGVPTCSN